jgi:hypothetical protein
MRVSKMGDRKLRRFGDGAMAISVLLPDGSMLKVPGQLIRQKSANGSHLRFRQIPINCDPLWRFIFDRGVWCAKPRHGPSVAHFPAREDPGCWWDGIWQMDDNIALDDRPGTALSTAA